MADLQTLGANGAIIRSIVHDSSASIWRSLRSLVEKFRAGLEKSLSETFRAGLIVSQFHADAVIDGNTLHFSEGAALDNDDDSTKAADFVDTRQTLRSSSSS